MITKITSKLTPVVKQPVRANLQKAASVGLAVLAGSSMSGWHGPRYTTVEKIIPGGLDLKEKAYFLIKGKLPPSVYERWHTKGSDYIPQEGDQVVSVNMYDGEYARQYVGEIVEAPHAIGTTDYIEPLDADSLDVLTSDTSFIDGDLDGDGDLSMEEIILRFLGQY